MSEQNRFARRATTISPHTAARHTGTTGPSGLAAACSSESALGFTAPTTSTATLITVSIHITATLVHIRTVETSPLITSTETRCVMGAATQTEVVQAEVMQAEAMEAEAMEAEAIARNSDKLKANGCYVADTGHLKRCPVIRVITSGIISISRALRSSRRRESLPS